MEFKPHVTVATVVERDARFLLVEEYSNGNLVINQPAGHLETDETLQQAALRETLEETAWEVQLLGVVGVSLYTAPANGVTYLRSTFAARPLRRLQQDLDKAIVRAVWLSLEEMRACSGKMRSPLVIASVEQYLAGSCYPLELIY
jgi:ADP-ribose pyrophosphatase YjhB (NUDIX family)